MKFTLSALVVGTSIFGAASAYNSLYARGYDDEYSLYAREADFDMDADYDLYAREADFDDDELVLVSRSLIKDLVARSLSRSSSSSSSSGLFAAPLRSNTAPAHNGGFSPISPTRETPHFVRTGAYTLDGNGGRRHSTGSSTAFNAPPGPGHLQRAHSL